jgi:hypothetical protein
MYRETYVLSNKREKEKKDQKRGEAKRTARETHLVGLK